MPGETKGLEAVSLGEAVSMISVYCILLPMPAYSYLGMHSRTLNWRKTFIHYGIHPKPGKHNFVENKEILSL